MVASSLEAFKAKLNGILGQTGLVAGNPATAGRLKQMTFKVLSNLSHYLILLLWSQSV